MILKDVFQYCAKVLLLFFYISVSNANTLYEKHWLDNARIASDFAAKINRHLPSRQNTTTSIIGLDFHKIWVGDTSDIGTFTFQPYIVYTDSPDQSSTELTWRISNFNYHVVNNRSINIRVGHFEIPFGIEQHIDTNGTLRQYTFINRGIKTDWGVTINGTPKNYEYEVALSSGTEQSIDLSSDSYIFSGRLGNSSQSNLIMGFSWFKGKTLNNKTSVEQHYVAVDLAAYYRNWEFLAELSLGNKNKQNNDHGLIEVSWRNAFENIHYYGQLKYGSQQNHQKNRYTDIIIGIKHNMLNGLIISMQYQRQIYSQLGDKNFNNFIAQLRYRADF